MTASFLAIFILLSSLVLWGGVGWDNNVMSKCVSHVLAPWSSLPVGWGEEGWGGVGWDINVIFDCWKLTSALDATCSLVDLERFQPSLWRMASAGQASEWKPSGSHSRSLWGTGVLRPQAGVEIDMPLPDIGQTEFDVVLMFWNMWL